MNRELPSVLSPTNAVNPPSGKVYETPSTFNASPVALVSNSASVPLALPASREISSESSPLKLVLKSIWKP